MVPALRKLVLTTHVVVSIGWFGAAAAVLALGVTGLATRDPSLANGAYAGTEVIWRFVIIPFSLAALATGLIEALGTDWGLFRHYWVLAKAVITVGAVALLLLHTGSLLPALSRAAAAEASGALQAAGAHVHGGLPPRVHLVVAAGGTLLLLLTTATLSIYKPWGKTPYGRRSL